MTGTLDLNGNLALVEAKDGNGWLLAAKSDVEKQPDGSWALNDSAEPMGRLSLETLAAATLSGSVTGEKTIKSLVGENLSVTDGELGAEGQTGPQGPEGPQGPAGEDATAADVDGQSITPSNVGTEDDPVDESHVVSQHTDELLVGSGGSSTEFPSGNVRTKTPLVVLEDTDTTTPLSLDTGGLSEHDEIQIEGYVGGYGAGAFDDVEIRVNGSDDTNTQYTYTSVEKATLSQTMGVSGFREQMYDTWSMRSKWSLLGSQQGSTLRRSVSISSDSTAHRQAANMLFGELPTATLPITSVQVLTGFNAVAKLLVYGVDF